MARSGLKVLGRATPVTNLLDRAAPTGGVAPSTAAALKALQGAVRATWEAAGEPQANDLAYLPGKASAIASGSTAWYAAGGKGTPAQVRSIASTYYDQLALGKLSGPEKAAQTVGDLPGAIAGLPGAFIGKLAPYLKIAAGGTMFLVFGVTLTYLAGRRSAPVQTAQLITRGVRRTGGSVRSGARRASDSRYERGLERQHYRAEARAAQTRGRAAHSLPGIGPGRRSS